MLFDTYRYSLFAEADLMTGDTPAEAIIVSLFIVTNGIIVGNSPNIIIKLWLLLTVWRGRRDWPMVWRADWPIGWYSWIFNSNINDKTSGIIEPMTRPIIIIIQWEPLLLTIIVLTILTVWSAVDNVIFNVWYCDWQPLALVAIYYSWPDDTVLANIANACDLFIVEAQCDPVLVIIIIVPMTVYEQL